MSSTRETSKSAFAYEAERPQSRWMGFDLIETRASDMQRINIDRATKSGIQVKTVFTRWQDDSSIKPTTFPQQNEWLPYDDNAMNLREMYVALIGEMQRQHDQTREVVHTEATKTRNVIISCIKENPIEAVMLFSRVGLVLGIFLLVVQTVLGTWVFNPWLAIAACLGSIAGLGMAALRKRSSSGT